MPSHVGLVEEVVPGEGDLPGYLVTIEGNVSDPNGPNACVRRVIRSFDRVLGYGTYEKGKTYSETYSVRFPSWRVIDADSIYFVEYPSEEVLRFLGLYGSQYYAYWFPEGPAAEAEDLQEQLPLGVHLDPVLKPQRREMNMRFCGVDGGK